MTNWDIEPLEPRLWFVEWEKLLARRAVMNGSEPDALFRKAFYLVQLTPGPLREILPCRVDEVTMEAYLDCGAYLAAAMALIDHPTAVTLVRDEASTLFWAAVRPNGSRVTGQDTDEHPAKALLGAWCQAMLALRSPEGAFATIRSSRATAPFAPQVMRVRH
jgi:hypothetical protein